MKHLENPFVIDLNTDGISTLERFVEYVCDQLFMNDTYSGNLLIALSEFLSLNQIITKKGKVNLSYSTDFQKIKINFQPIENQVITILQSEVTIDETLSDSAKRSIYLLHTLVDEMAMINDNTITLSFDISAIHNKIYMQRSHALNAYFNQAKVKIVKRNDSI